MPSTAAMTVLCAGEALLDLVWSPVGRDVRGGDGVELHPGGSTANVAVSLARLGIPSRMCTTVGQDDMGAWLTARLGAEGVDTAGVFPLRARRTGLVFIHVDAHAERHFTPARESTADAFLAPRHAPARVFRAVDLVLYSSGPLKSAEGRGFVDALKRHAARRDAWLTLDANLRPRMWPSVEANARAVLKAAEGAHILKANAEEAHALTGHRNPERAVRALRRHATEAAVVTTGPDGALAVGHGGVLHVPSPDVKAVDTTGAGDAFMAGMLAVLASHRSADDATLMSALRLGTHLGALACTRPGATAAMPRPANGAAYIRRHARG